MPEDNNLAYTLAGIGRKRDPYDRRRSFAERLRAQGMDSSPVDHPLQGAARLAQALVGGYMGGQVDRDEKKATEDRNTKMTAAMSEADPTKRIGLISALDPELGIRLSGQMAIDQAKTAQQREGLGAIAGTYGAPPQGAMPPSGGYQGTLGGFESGNNPQAVNPQSGAGGQFQFMPQTWAEVRAKHPDLQLPETPMQASPQQQAAAEARFRDSNAQTLQGAGIPPTPANLYLAHRAGAQGAQTLLKTDPNAPMETVVPQSWIAQNPDMRGKTVGQFVQMAQARFGNGPQQGGPPPASPVNVQATPPGQPQPLQVNMPGPAIPQGATDTNGMPPTPSPQGVQGPTMSAPPVPPQRMTPRDMPPQMAAPYIDRLKRGGYGMNPAEAEQRMVADMQRALDVSFENQRIEYDRLLKDFDYGRGRADKQTETNQKRGDEQTKQKFEFENKLRDDFNSARAARAYQIAVPLVETAKDAATRPSRAADLNLINAFAKTMDPDSAVMSGERGEVIATASVADRVAAYVGQLNGQAQLSPDTRAKLIAELDSRFNSLKASYEAHEDAYRGIAERNGLNFDNVRIPVRRPPAEGGNAPAGGGQRQRISLDGKPL
jgi:hypothetical protein